jgi:DDE superfamily endonuclease
MADSLAASVSRDEPGLAAIRPGRFYASDETIRSFACILRVTPAGALLLRLAGLPELFTRPTWRNALLLLTGAILAPGKRTVTAALRILGREQETDFPIYHGVLSRAVWSSRAVASWMLRLLVASFLSADATVVIGIDDTIERRWGHKISARGIYRDPVRSSKGHFVKTSGLRWLSAQLLVHIPWAGRIMGLPFLTMLAPSKRFYADTPRAAKTLLDWARQAALQIHRWLPDRRIVLVGDTALAAIGFLAAVRSYLSVVTRLRLDANLYAPAPSRRRRRGRPPVKGKRLAKLNQVLHDPRTVWHRHTVTLWYGRTNRTVELATGTAVWYHSGLPPVPIRWLLVRDPLGELQPQAFLSTDLDAAAVDILQWFVSRWQLEVTFQDARAHLGVETQRQWSDLAILRTTPALLGLFSLVALWAHDLAADTPLAPATAAWYPKTHCTFSDAIAAVRRRIWHHQSSCMSRRPADVIKMPRQLWQRAANELAYAA